jgi:hypothetical protein
MNMSVLKTDSHNASGPVARNSSPHLIYSEEEAFLHMTRRRSENEQLLYTIADEVLFNVWDALCLSINQGYREAYLPYLPHVFDLLRTTEDGLDLHEYLVFIEETEMDAFKGDMLSRRRASMAVDLLLNYRDSIFADSKEIAKQPA